MDGFDPLTYPLARSAGVAGSDPRSHREDGDGGGPASVVDAAEAIFVSSGLGGSIDEEMPDSVFAAEDWLDVTHAMLNCVDP